MDWFDTIEIRELGLFNPHVNSLFKDIYKILKVGLHVSFWCTNKIYTADELSKEFKAIAAVRYDLPETHCYIIVSRSERNSNTSMYWVCALLEDISYQECTLYCCHNQLFLNLIWFYTDCYVEEIPESWLFMTEYCEYILLPADELFVQTPHIEYMEEYFNTRWTYSHIDQMIS